MDRTDEYRKSSLSPFQHLRSVFSPIFSAGHIACDSASKSEIVVPLVVSRDAVKGLSQLPRQRDDKAVPIEWQGRGDGEEVIIGVLDIDCEAEEGFDDADVRGLETVVQIIARSCDW